jgi:hypothetical protein
MNENNDIVGKIIQGYKILKPIGNLFNNRSRKIFDGI